VETKKFFMFSELTLAEYGETIDEHSGNVTKLDSFVSNGKEMRAERLYKRDDLIGKKARNVEELLRRGDSMSMKVWLNQLQDLEEALRWEDDTEAGGALKLKSSMVSEMG
jgi:hypothetical protein